MEYDQKVKEETANGVDCLDIVATQGVYLVPRADPPVFQEAYNAQFAATLKQQLDAVITEQICRHVMYHGAADEWPMGHTPPEMKEKRKVELKALEELEGATSGDGSDNDGDGDGKDKTGNNIDAIVGVENPAASDRARRARRLRQANWLQTLPLFAESPLATLCGRKRRRISKESARLSSTMSQGPEAAIGSRGGVAVEMDKEWPVRMAGPDGTGM
ncbi:hypothetical protein V8F20_012740 [Naviculisporaceae sp. PSN 640]